VVRGSRCPLRHVQLLAALCAPLVISSHLSAGFPRCSPVLGILRDDAIEIVDTDDMLEVSGRRDREGRPSRVKPVC